MKKRLNQLSIVSIGLFLLTTLTIKAASVAPGATFTATATCGNIEGSVKVTTSNATLISGDNWCDRGKTLSAKAKAGSSGTATITFVTVDATDVAAMKDASGVTLGRKSVSVVKPSKPSDNTGGNTSGGYNTPSYNIPDYETSVTNGQ